MFYTSSSCYCYSFPGGWDWFMYVCIIVHFLIERLSLLVCYCYLTDTMSENEMEINSMKKNFNHIDDDQHGTRGNAAEELIDLITP